MNYVKFIRIFLLVLIIIGVGLLITQKIWVPKVVEVILQNEKTEQQITKISDNKDETIAAQGPSLEKLKVIEGTDYHYFSDGKIIYYRESFDSKIMATTSIDSATLQVVGRCDFEMGYGSEYYIVDRQSIYALGKIIMSSNYFKYIGSVAAGGEGSIGLFTDGKSVYLGCKGRKIDSLDPNSVEVVGGIYIKDNKNIFRPGPDADGVTTLVAEKNVNPNDCVKENLNKCSSSGVAPY